MEYKKVLIATDLTEGSEHLFKQAVKRLPNAKFCAVHVVEHLPGYGYAFISPMEIETQLFEEAKKQLAKLGESVHIPSKRLYTLMGPTKAEVLQVAEEEKVDLIIVGAHNRNGWGYLLGSTANALIHSAPCDVLAIRVE